MREDIFKEVEHTTPQQVIHINDGKSGALGYLSIDSLVGGRCGGGIRMYEGISVEETNALARSMTLKFGFLGMPRGGAKAGIIDTSNGDVSQREERIRLFAKGLDYFINRGIYLPGADLGTSEDDVSLIYHTLGIPYKAASGAAATSVYTGFTLLCCIEKTLEFFKRKINNATFAIQGFGNVGIEIARVLSQRGGKIIAISNVKGALMNREGLNIEYLLTQYAHYGDEFILREGDDLRMNRDDLLELDVDALIPCAGSWSLHALNAERIKARFIFPGANIPVTQKAQEMLEGKGIVIIPDFICNSGGVFGSSLRFLGFTQGEMKKIIDEVFTKKLYTLLGQARKYDVSLCILAREGAMEKFNTIRERMNTHSRKKFFECGIFLLKKVPFVKRLSKKYLQMQIKQMVLQ